MASTLERNRRKLEANRGKKHGLSSNQQKQSERAFYLMEEERRTREQHDNFSDSVMAYSLGDALFEAQLEMYDMGLQRLVELLRIEFPQVSLSFVESNIFPTLIMEEDGKEAVTIVVVKDERERLEAFQSLIKKNVPNSQQKEVLRKNRVIIQFARPDTSQEKLLRSFTETYEQIT